MSTEALTFPAGNLKEWLASRLLRPSFRGSVESIHALIDRGPYVLGESYARGEWDAEDLDEIMYYVFCADLARLSLAGMARRARYFLGDFFGNPQRLARAFNIGRVHYDLGNDLFSCMLDNSMSYTSGYWQTAKTLEEAQEAKLDLACRKLGLQRGMRVLDLGCGWGNFAKFAAENYSVSVVGLTVSKEQAALAGERCRGLAVEIRLEDYRGITGQFDRLVSLEMIEAVGRKNLPVFFQTAHRCLKPGGMFLLEVISCDPGPMRLSPCLSEFLMWILKYIFPDGYLPTLTELAAPCEKMFIMEDLHSFGQDYDRTLMCWAANFDRGWEALRSRYDETFRRRWRFYLLSCAALFRARRIQLYQIVYSKEPGAGRYSAQR